jgi:hypothetical protein
MLTKELVSSMRKALKLTIPKNWKFSFRVTTRGSGVKLIILKTDVDLLAQWAENFHKVNRREIDNDRSLCFNALSLTNPNYSLYFSDGTNAIFRQIAKIMSKGNYDNSDIQSDYFDIGYFSHIEISKFHGYLVLA